MSEPVQYPLFPEALPSLSRQAFSHGDVCPQEQRRALEARYADLLTLTEKYSRKWVSYQGNKGSLVHGWIRYKEGFSAFLVEGLMREFGIRPGDTVLDPFSGSATTLLVARMMGVNAVGIEILPVCHLTWEAKSHVGHYDLNELRQVQSWLQDSRPEPVDEPFPHISITEGAFPPQTESELMYYTRWAENLPVSPPTRTLLRLLLTSILEEISYTRKDGQYLRWDSRSPKVQQRNQQRLAQGKPPLKPVNFGPLPDVKTALLQALQTVVADIQKLQTVAFPPSEQRMIQGNALLILPGMEANQFDGVITSPPYCNRYDYTRTYALEIAYLGHGKSIRDLRQSQLSCTVENRPKLAMLEETYRSLGKTERFQRILHTVQSNPAFQEVNQALQVRWERGDLNNRGVLRMVEQYFIELAFIFAEVLRTCKPGAQVAFVNDNVRYGGEVIPVDLLTTDIAVALGFEAVKVYVLPQRKGNSSQQMGRFGREALRKSITIWRKPQ